MNSLACAYAFPFDRCLPATQTLAPDPRPTAPADRLFMPYLCPTCGSRSSHNARHYTPGNEGMCGAEMVWDGNQRNQGDD